jgi:hypothetical protein
VTLPFRSALLAFGLLTSNGVADVQHPDKAPPKVLWRAPHPMAAGDWICGPGGCDRVPVAPFQFIKEDLSGTNVKLTVRDANGRTWSVKFGAEVIPECFAPRFLEALGYAAEPTYFVASGRITGVHDLVRARRIVKRDGSFTKARFELRGQADLVFLNGRSWSWVENPFRGTPELAGMKIAMMTLSNWDAKDARDGNDSNNGVFREAEGTTWELRYEVFDWGASLGRWGGILRRDQSDCAGFAEDTRHFITGVRQNVVEWGFKGKHWQDLTAGISVDDVRWLLPYLKRITLADLRSGLKASGATRRQAACWADEIGNRIQQLSDISQ